jgi:hypothetical protein
MYTIVAADGNEYGPVDMATLQQWAHEGRVTPVTQVTTIEGGTRLQADQMPELQGHLSSFGQYQAPIAAPQSLIGSKMIPSGNPPALWSYYVGIASLAPCVGGIAGPAAIICGVKGLKKFRENPAVYGKAHAIVGIVLGSIGCVITYGLIAVLFAASATPSRGY